MYDDIDSLYGHVNEDYFADEFDYEDDDYYDDDYGLIGGDSDLWGEM